MNREEVQFGKIVEGGGGGTGTLQKAVGGEVG